MPDANFVLPESNVVRSESFLPMNRLRRTEFYSDWGKRNNVVYSIGANLKIEDKKLLYLGLNRGERSGPYRETVPELLSVLSPQLQKAIQIQDRLHFATQSVESIHAAVFILAADGRVLEMSPRAQNLVELKDGVMLDSKRHLVPAHRDDREALTAALEELRRTWVKSSRALRIRRPESLPPHFLFLVPVRRSPKLPFTTAEFTAVVLPAETTRAAVIEVVGPQLFGLTKAEARLAAALVEVGSLDGAEEHLSITRNTAKTQMAAIFCKTGTKRQGEAVRLLVSIASITHMGDET